MNPRINTLTKRIYRNKLRIRDHLALAIIASFFTLYIAIFQHDNAELVIYIAIGMVIISDLLMIAWHKYRIRKYRKELAELTGVDYTRIDNQASLGEGINDLTLGDFNGFYDKLQAEEKRVIEKARKGEVLNLIEKTLLFTVEERFKQYCENRGLVCMFKIKEIDPTTLPKKKQVKKTKKMRKTGKKNK